MPRPGPFTIMRRHWKKSTAFMTIANGSLWLTYDYTVTSGKMRVNCQRAALLGDQRLKNFNGQPRHITVILNPIAGKRKSKKLYSKWVEPLLHLSGIKVSLIETESPNQAYDLMKIMSNCDGVAIVGGDGTVHEALNGLLHRSDCLKATKDFPIGIMPTGQYNTIARYIHQNLSYRNQKEFLIEATMRLVDSCTQKFDVLKVSPLDEEQKEEEKPVYVLRDVRYGKYQDNYVKVSGYLFYQTYIKPVWLRLHRLLSSKCPKPQIENISYSEPCIGCSRCFEKHRLKESQSVTTEEDKSVNRRWWGMLAPISRTQSGPSEEERRELELASRENPNCDRWIDYGDTSDVTDIRACMMGDKKIRLSIGIKGEYTPSETIEAQDIKMKLAPDLDNEMKKASQKQESGQQMSSNEQSAEVAEGGKKEEEDKTVKFLIDGQPTQAHSIKITTLKEPVTIFTGLPKFVFSS